MTAPTQPQQPAQPAATKTRKPLLKRWWFWLIVVVAVLAIGGAIGGATGGSGQSPQPASAPAATAQKDSGSGQTTPAEKPKPAEKTVEFQATATGNGTVIWTRQGSSNTEQFSGTWSKTFTGDEAKDLTGVSVTGDIMGGNDQKVTCKVIVNGEQKDAKEASGSAGSAHCTVPLF